MDQEIVDRLTKHLSERIRRLCREVLIQLPTEWDDRRRIGIEEWDEIPNAAGSKIIYGYARREVELNEEGEFDLLGELYPQEWALILSRRNLESISDAAVRWVIARELGHIAIGLRSWDPDIPTIEAQKDAAEQLALQWGFSDGLSCFISETTSDQD